ncbi:hypothetical protein B0H13DRAFT_1853319 [Mycena leptocephala]|nr:hypothetical protein B0H13DRAFT_1853319 [Mycena leptocephala]
MGGAASSVQTGIMQISGEREGNDNEDCETGGGHLHDELWQRNDRAEWTAELGRAHPAFERGRGWGLDWAVCVQKFYDFEAAWGFVECLPIEGKRDGSHAACFNFEEVRGFGLPTGPPSASLGNHVGSVYTAAGAWRGYLRRQSIAAPSRHGRHGDFAADCACSCVPVNYA